MNSLSVAAGSDIVTRVGSSPHAAEKRVYAVSLKRSAFLPKCARFTTIFPAAKTVHSSGKGGHREIRCASASRSGKFLGKAPSPGEAMGKASSAVSSGAEKVGNKLSQAGPEAGLISLVIAIAAPVIIGAIIASVNQPSSEWYKSLNKPSWNPPDWLFGAAWSVLYSIIGYSGWLIWSQGGWEAQSGPLTTYIIQLILNFAWPAICFGGKNLGLALVDIGKLRRYSNNIVTSVHLLKLWKCVRQHGRLDHFRHWS